MKVLHIINWLATGGAEKLIIETLPLLNKRADICVDLALLDASDYQFYKELKINKPHFEIYELSKGSVYNPLLIFKIIPLLNKYDVIHVHLFPALYWVVIAKIISFSKTKLIFTEHSTNNRRFNNPKFKLIDKFVYQYYEKIVCISNQVKTQLINVLDIKEEKLTVITNGINTEDINNALPLSRQEFGYNDEDLIITKVAGFRREKDHETLLSAMIVLPERFKLLLVGDGERRKEIESLISVNNLNDRVQLLGVRSDVYSLLKMSDISVLSSHWEGFGLAAAESMAAGVPVVASNVEGLSQVVDGGGILFDKGNVQDLKCKIMDLANDKLLRDKYIALGKTKSGSYDIQEMINQIFRLYSKLT